MNKCTCKYAGSMESCLGGGLYIPGKKCPCCLKRDELWPELVKALEQVKRVLNYDGNDALLARAKECDK